MKKTSSIQAYISTYPKDVQTILQTVYVTIKKAVPKDTEEKIAYGIPTFKMSGVNLVHFGGFAKHIGFFPTSFGVTAFAKDLKKYKTSKGTIQFQLDEPIPYSLITKIVKYRVKYVKASPSKK